MEVSTMVQNVVSKINEAAVEKTENRVETLVNQILAAESQITQHQRNIAAYKKELKELQMPTPVAVNLE